MQSKKNFLKVEYREQSWLWVDSFIDFFGVYKAVLVSEVCGNVIYVPARKVTIEGVFPLAGMFLTREFMKQLLKDEADL